MKNCINKYIVNSVYFSIYKLKWILKKLKQLFYVECHVIPHVWSRYTISHKIAVNHFVFFADRCLFLFPKLTKKKDVFKWTNRYHFIQNEKKNPTHTKYIFIIYQKFQIIKLFKIIFLIIFMSRYHVGVLMKLTLET